LSAAPPQHGRSFNRSLETFMQRTLNNAVHWFEIPVVNLDRAQAFYEKLLGQPLKRESMGPVTLAVFAYDEGVA
jgi:predicted enzyme related to lactoylglutathione lyase